MEYYMDEKWQIWRDDNGRNGNSSGKSTLSRSMSQRSSTVSHLRRSLSHKNSFNLSRSSSQKSTGANAKSASLSRTSSQKCVEFTRKCSSLAKEQRARLYIVKRCISMLVRWKKNVDS